MTSLTFLSLPGEIRNQVYNQLLIVPSLSIPRIYGDPPLYPQILTVSRKIHSEAQEILYGSNTFLAHPNLLTGLPRLRLYYDTISSSHLIALIRRYHIRIRLDCDPNFSATKARDAFAGVEELTLEVFQAQFGSSDHKVLKLFEGIRGVKAAKIYGSVTAFPEYVEWLQNTMMSPRDSMVAGFGAIPARDTVRSYDMWNVL
jgi:hypothetical protein